MKKVFTLFMLFLSVTLLAGNASALTTISGNITASQTWGPTGSPADTEYLLSGYVFVQAPAELTIQPGVKIYGEEATIGTLIIERGARLHAIGTPTQPIVFTSSRVKFGGALDRGLWGGVIIAGDAPINVPGGEALIEGTANSMYGGNDPADNSGELQYVRIEYAGHLFSPEVELNGIAFHGVGSGTTVDHVQVHMNKDDCIEMFGGTVNMKYMIGTWCRDDYFDWTEGWQGKAQYIVVAQRADEADRGFECDNNATNPGTATPFSNPTIYNVTLIGDPTTVWGTESTQGMLLRVGTAGKIRNLIVSRFKNLGGRMDNTETWDRVVSGDLVVSNGIVFGNNGGGAQFDTDVPVSFQNAINLGYFTNLSNVDPMLCNPLPEDIYVAPIDSTLQYKPNFAPAAGSPAINGAVPVAIPPADGFFDTSVDFIGAIDPDNDWTYGWTTFGSAKQYVADVTYDGNVNVFDVVKIKKIAVGSSHPQACANANGSADGLVNVFDVVRTKQIAVNPTLKTLCCTE
jgi:hypothetical protein